MSKVTRCPKCNNRNTRACLKHGRCTFCGATLVALEDKVNAKLIALCLALNGMIRKD